MTPIIDVTDVTRTFGSGPNATAALRGVIAGLAPKTREERVATMLTLVGLADGTILQES